MQIDCPRGWKSSAKLGNVTLESTVVTIAGGICDSCDLCGIEVPRPHVLRTFGL